MPPYTVLGAVNKDAGHIFLEGWRQERRQMNYDILKMTNKLGMPKKSLTAPGWG